MTRLSVSATSRHGSQIALVVDGGCPGAVHLAPHALLLLHVQHHHLQHDLMPITVGPQHQEISALGALIGMRCSAYRMRGRCLTFEAPAF